MNSATDQFVRTPFGTTADKPTPAVADYDGDGEADINLYDPVYVVSHYGASATNQFVRTAFGSPEDKPIPVAGPQVQPWIPIVTPLSSARWGAGPARTLSRFGKL